MEQQEKSSTLEFIQLVRCIVEYYGTTKTASNTKEDKIVENTVENTLENQLNEAEKLLSSVGDFDLGDMSIDVPNEIDTAVKKTFLAQLKKFEEYSKYVNS